MNTRSHFAFAVCIFVAGIGWGYGLYAGMRARRCHVGGRAFRWSERTRWRDLTPVGRQWQLRSTAGFVVFVLVLVLALLAWGDYHPAA